MATAFGADLAAVRAVSQDLKGVRGELAAMNGVVGDTSGVTGSGHVSAALSRFVSRSSDQREALDRLLERATGLLDELVAGAGQVDSALAAATQPAVAP